jgi:hypothetical protein
MGTCSNLFSPADLRKKATIHSLLNKMKPKSPNIREHLSTPSKKKLKSRTTVPNLGVIAPEKIK